MSISFKSFLTLGAFICWKSKLIMFEPNLFLIFSTLGWSWYEFIILPTTSLSFKDASVIPILLGLFPQLFSTMLIQCLLNICQISCSSVMTFSPSINVMSLLAIMPLFVMKGLIKFQKLLLVSILFSEILSIYLLILFLLILTHLFLYFLYAALFSADGSTQYLFINLLLT